jgi:hypothetical protein
VLGRCNSLRTNLLKQATTAGPVEEKKDKKALRGAYFYVTKKDEAKEGGRGDLALTVRRDKGGALIWAGRGGGERDACHCAVKEDVFSC